MEASTTFVVGAPALETAEATRVDGVRPGSVLKVPVALRNSGNLPTGGGVGLLLYGTEGLNIARSHSNCRYQPREDLSAAWCSFDTDIAPGAAYETAAPLEFATAGSLMYGSVNYQVWSLDGPAPYGFREADYTEAGKGAELALEPASGGSYDRFGGYVDRGPPPPPPHPERAARTPGPGGGGGAHPRHSHT
ncbi:hypothetical protein ACFW9F_21315, partial [Streptomyces sp. NPDC059506]